MRFYINFFTVALLLAVMTLPGASVAADKGGLRSAVELFDKQKYTEARHLLEDLLEDGEENGAMFYYLGRLDLIDGDHESAVKYLERTVDIDPDESEHHYWLAVSVMRKAAYSNFLGRMNNMRKALDAFNTAIELDPQNIRARMTVFQMMVRSFKRGGVKEEELIKQAQSIDGIDSAMGYVAYGTYFQFAENDMERAGEQFEKGYDLSPGNRAVAISYADYLWLVDEKDEAIRALDSYVQEKPDDKPGHFALGAKIVLRGNNNEAARELFERCLLLKSETGMPTEAMVRWCLGLVCHLAGEEDVARAEWSRVYELDSNFDSILKTTPLMSELNSILSK